MPGSSAQAPCGWAGVSSLPGAALRQGGGSEPRGPGAGPGTAGELAGAAVGARAPTLPHQMQPRPAAGTRVCTFSDVGAQQRCSERGVSHNYPV